MLHFPSNFVAQCSTECSEHQQAPTPVAVGEHFLCESHLQWWFSRPVEAGGFEWVDVDFVPWPLWRDAGYLSKI